MSRKHIAAAIVFAVSVGIGLEFSSPASAAYCVGTVHGLSRYYNLATGSGFLAVRRRPTSSSAMVGQLFNGDTVRILDRAGSWYQIRADGLRGWAHRKWMRNSCNH
jgi:uncharacterized protein YgiM (DUF1202 family)